MGNAMHTEPQEFTENAANELYLSQLELGVDPEGSYQRHVFQFHNLGGGSVEVLGKGPEGTYATLTSGKVEGDVFALSFPYPSFKFEFSGTGGSGKVTVKSYRTRG